MSRTASIAILSLLVGSAAVAAGRDTADPGPGAPDRAQALVQKMIAAYGGMERWNAVRGVSFRLRDLMYGLGTGKPVVSETRHLFSKDPRPMLRIDIRIGKNNHTKVYDGLEAWMAVDGVLLRKGQATYRRIRDAAKNTVLWVSFPFNLMYPGTRVDYVGESRVMGIDTYVLQVRWDDRHSINPDDIYRFYVNKLTHLVVREIFFLHGESENRIETLYGDYRTVNGLVKDHLREIVASSDGRKLQRIEIEELRFGVELPPELFEKPSDPMLRAAPLE